MRGTQAQRHVPLGPAVRVATGPNWRAGARAPNQMPARTTSCTKEDDLTIPGRALPRYTESIMWPLEIWSPDESAIVTLVYQAEFEHYCEEDAIWGRGSKTRLRQVFWHERPFNERGLWRRVRRMPAPDSYVWRQPVANTFKVWAHKSWRIRQAIAEDARHSAPQETQ